MAKFVTPAEVLAVKLHDEGDEDIHEYLIDLLAVVWKDGEQFSGKYGATGDSDWQYDLYIPLVREGLVEGELDEWGEIIEEKFFDEDAARKLIADAIRSLHR